MANFYERLINQPGRQTKDVTERFKFTGAGGKPLGPKSSGRRVGTNGGVPVYSRFGKRTVQQPIVEPEELFESIRKEFAKQPVSFAKDASGNVVANRRFNLPDIPDKYKDLKAFKDLAKYYDKPLTTSYVLPGTALDGQRFENRAIPQTEAQRQQGYTSGVSGTQTGNMAAVSPETWFPQSRFQLPFRAADKGFAKDLAYDQYDKPISGSTVDFTTGEMRTPERERFSGSTYSRFNPRSGQTPNAPGGVRKPFGFNYRWGGALKPLTLQPGGSRALGGRIPIRF